MIIYLNGKSEKSILLSNQQETSNFEGSSETYTQSSSNDLNNIKSLNNINSAKPAHIKSYNENFLNWFVGFSEGDGSFVLDYKKQKPSFIITQKDPKVLYYLRKHLGFGKVYLCKDSYYRFIVSKKDNLFYLIQIFSSKLILNKTNIRFYKWIKFYKIYFNIKEEFQINYVDLDINKNSAWLSGFIDAEGCFDAYQRNKRLTFRIRFSIKQKGEYNIFKELPYLWIKKNGHLLINKDLVVFTMDSIVSLKNLIKYLEKFNLHSNKNINYNKWLKLFRVLEDGCRGKDYETIKKMAQNINKYEDEDKVQNLEKN
jgi:hypothetical protein